jgi:glycosyltransferase involved in cell wall biosynthesis
MSKKNNVILADCESDEVKTLQDGLNDNKSWNFTTESCISNGSHAGKGNIKRYLKYFTFPWHVFLHRKKYNCILGWQQFYTINFAFYSRLFHVNKKNRIVALNFTYKRKGGFVGRLYEKYMRYAVDSEYIDYFHVLSKNYAESCSKVLNIPLDKFIVTTFGVPDIYDKWKNSNVEENDYTLSIGRSNRDFDFLVKAWKQPCLSKRKLVIISDMYHPTEPVPNNIKLLNDVTGDASYPWIANCNMMVIPIEDGTICSGDTVLLNSMLMKKPVVVTKPSTLSEMYLEDRVDGLTLEKDEVVFAQEIAKTLENKDECRRLGENARKKYLAHFSRFQLGKQIQPYIEKLSLK